MPENIQRSKHDKSAFVRERTFVHVPTNLGYDDLVCNTPQNGPRTYQTPDGQKLFSITTILSILSEDHIREWRHRVGNDEANLVSRSASRRGTALHSLVERYLKNEQVVLNGSEMPDVRQMFLTLLPEINKRVGKVMLQEAALYSTHLGVAGRTDLVAEFDGRVSIVDIKSSGRIKSKDDITSYFIQECAYAIMYEERTGKPITQLVILMAVEGQSKPLVFIEHRDNWTKQLHATIKSYRQRHIFGQT